MAFGLTPEGFVKKRIADIKAEIEASLRADLGAEINLLPAAVLGQIVGVVAEREALLWELGEEVYNSQYPDTASDVNLDNVVGITGIERLPATKSLVTATLTGTVGTVVPTGFIFRVAGTTHDFETIETVTIDGPTDVRCQALVTGPVPAVAGTLTEIPVGLVGLTSVTNAEDAEVGRDLETDDQMRLRRRNSLQIAGAATPDAIRARVRDLDGVSDVIVFENDTMIEDGDGRPAKSYEVVVNGGVDQEIADTIWATKPAGIRTHGTELETVADSQGFSKQVRFSRPTEVDIWIDVTVTGDFDFVATEADIKEILATYGNQTFGIGKDVVVYPKLICSLDGVVGLVDVELKIGIAPVPTLDDNIDIAPNEIPKFDTSRITVTIV